MKNKIDLSSEKDLSIGIMNLISIEEHLYFSGIKTGKNIYFDILTAIRALRKKLMKELIQEPEGEVWCISKHLLGASMRLIEVGNKQPDKKNAYEKFQQAFYLYSLFWGLNLKLIKSEKLKTNKISSIVKKIIECCKE